MPTTTVTQHDQPMDASSWVSKYAGRLEAIPRVQVLLSSVDVKVYYRRNLVYILTFVGDDVVVRKYSDDTTQVLSPHGAYLFLSEGS